ncbi:MAG: hypothetical protein ABL931_05115 [Usitatibacteraceae bacterium]
MPVLFFYPWLKTKQPLSLGVIDLVQYERGKSPHALDGMLLADIDAVFANYGEPDFANPSETAPPVSSATLLSFPGDDPTSALSDDEIQIRLRLGRLIAFCSLANRLFGGIHSYANADVYEVIAQRYDPARPGSMVVTTRRRDGRTQQLLGSRSSHPRFPRPMHVFGHAALAVDVALFRAIAGITEPALAARLEDAVELFLLANSDSPNVPERAEVVMLRAAFETLLESGHKASELVKGFANHFHAALPDPPVWAAGVYDEAAWRARWPTATRPLDAWVQDFCAARNTAAHGMAAMPAPLWPRGYHLLFATWLLPLVIKGILAKDGHYTLSRDDTLLRAGLEAFLAADLLHVEPKETEPAWSKVERNLLFDAWMRDIT